MYTVLRELMIDVVHVDVRLVSLVMADSIHDGLSASAKIKRHSRCSHRYRWRKRISMKLILTIFFIVKSLASIAISEEFKDDDVVETFRWTPSTGDTNIEWEFVVIGKRVTWADAKDLCAYRKVFDRSNVDPLDLENLFDYDNSTIAEKKSKINSIRRLAILDDDKAKTWLSRMLSESNYRYDGLWVGGHRTNSSLDWTWIENDNNEEVVIPSSTFFDNYPNWYKSNEQRDMEKNCLIFDKVGHDLPILVPTDCRLGKPFVCSRFVTKKNPERIVEGLGVDADGYHYTLFSVDDGQDEVRNLEDASGVRKLNGGGVKWREARLECRKRGQYLAVVLTNEAATAIAGIMLKNRPSMESAWLGSWSIDGTDWTWSPTGFQLSSTKSSTSQYPPWLLGHPVPSLDDGYRRSGRCLILDRHLCPDHMSPIFLDLDCEKKRPFVCQDRIPQRSGFENHRIPVTRKMRVGNKILEFSASQMTWNDGREYCANNSGRIASIYDSATLTAVLDKMTDLYLDHVWVGGRTEKRTDGWRWFDETGKALSRKGIGTRSSWCLGDDEGFWPKADPDTCLNLDREGHGLPLFYGLPCDFAKQHVLCSIGHGSRSIINHDSAFAEAPKIQEKSKNPGKGILHEMITWEPDDKYDEWTTADGETATDYPNEWFDDDTNKNVGNNENIDHSDIGSMNISTEDSSLKNLGVGNFTKISEIFDENTDSFLRNEEMDGEVKINGTIEIGNRKEDITELSHILQVRIGGLAKATRSGMLFVIDDSTSVLNSWLAEELKFVGVVIRNIFSLSEEHPMGLFTLSNIWRLALNQTDVCSVFSYMYDKILENRRYHRDPNGSHSANRASNDLVKAAAAAVDVVKNSGLQRVAIVFVVDKEHRMLNDGNSQKELQSVMDKLTSLRNSGHEAYALFVGQHLRTSHSFFEFQELFRDSADGKKNIYTVDSFANLSELVSVLNLTAPELNTDLQCQ